MAALVSRCDEEKAHAEAAGEDERQRLSQLARDLWPALMVRWKSEELETYEALEAIDAWKGKTVRFSGNNAAGRTYEASYPVVIEIDGIPVCGKFDEDVLAKLKHFQEKTRVPPGANEEYIAVVEGRCKVWERVPDSAELK